MLIKIAGYKSNSDKGGESIRFSLSERLIVMCAEDVDMIISKLTEAKEYALNAEVEDEALEITFEL